MKKTTKIKKSCVHFKSIVSKMSVALGQNILFNFNMYLLYMLIGFTIALSIALVKQRDRLDDMNRQIEQQQIEIVELKSNWEYYISIINPEVIEDSIGLKSSEIKELFKFVIANKKTLLKAWNEGSSMYTDEWEELLGKIKKI